MKTERSRMAAAGNLQPVWCHHCCIRIAPYDLRKVFHGTRLFCQGRALEREGQQELEKWSRSWS